jgi:predicted P-loop ATPase
MKDISEAMIAGFTTKALEKTAVPMKTMQEKGRMNAAQRGYQVMQLAVEQIIAETNKQKQKEILLELHDSVENLAHAWLKFEPEMTKDFFRIQNCNGLGMSSKSLLRLIKASARNLKKDIRKELDAKPPTRSGIMPQEHVLQMLTYRANGKPEPTKLNVETILRYDTRWKGLIRYCQLSGRPQYRGNPVDDLVISKADSWISKTYGIETAHKTLGMLLYYVASEHEYHPIAEYLETLEWDGTHRLKDMARKIYRSPDCNDNNKIDKPRQELLGTYLEEKKLFGFEPDEIPSIVQIYIIRMFIGAVKRATDMGCKLDTVPVMIGEQGISKSQGIAQLCPEPKWHSDSKLDIRNKDVYQCIQGKWIVELPECSALHDSGYNTAKSFLSSRSDRYRMAYGAHAVDQKRSCIFIGTTNETQLGFLNDPSGTRRYWVFQVGHIAFSELIKKDYVSQLWAEAYHLTKKGAHHWLR